MEASRERCRNCDSPLDGEYCGSCGQREGRGDLYFSEAMGDAVGEVFTWDSRLWRTLLLLLFRPGYLSAEFNAGRRARYMPPFRLYLVISFVLFLVLSLITGDRAVYSATNADGETVIAPVVIGGDLEDVPEPYRERVEEAMQRREAAREAPGEETPDTDKDASEAARVAADGINIDLSGEGVPAWLQEFEPRLEKNAQRVRDDPAAFVDALLEYLPQTMFLMLPLFALLLKLLYLFSAFHYLQHLVFALHYHSFVYLMYLAASVFEAVKFHAGDVLILAIPVYLPIALRTAYGSGWGGAIGKALVICISYGLLLIFGFALVSVLVLLLM